MDTYKENWKELLEQFQAIRKPDADAIAELALQNFIEMRDLVSDPKFLKRKRIEAHLHERYPEQWIPLYTMVTFSDMPYSEALAMGKHQDQIMQAVMKKYADTPLEEIDYQEIISRL